VAIVLSLSCICRAGAHHAENRVARGRTAHVGVRARTGVTTQHVRRQLPMRSHWNFAPTWVFIDGTIEHVGVVPAHASIHIANGLSDFVALAVNVRVTCGGTGN
jgi:hypothetical protein